MQKTSQEELQTSNFSELILDTLLGCNFKMSLFKNLIQSGLSKKLLSQICEKFEYVEHQTHDTII